MAVILTMVVSDSKAKAISVVFLLVSRMVGSICFAYCLQSVLPSCLMCKCMNESNGTTLRILCPTYLGQGSQFPHL